MVGANGVPDGIVTSVVAMGTPQLQLEAVNQLVLVTPSQAFGLMVMVPVAVAAPTQPPPVGVTV